MQAVKHKNFLTKHCSSIGLSFLNHFEFCHAEKKSKQGGQHRPSSPHLDLMFLSSYQLLLTVNSVTHLTMYSFLIALQLRPSYILKLRTLFFSDIATKTPKHDKLASKRSLWNFNSMINFGTERNSLHYLGYGCWCGLGGYGRPVDDVDRCGYE